MFTLAISAGAVAGFVFAFIAVFVAGLITGAQVTSHEERALDYNLEDVELDELHKLEAELVAAGTAGLHRLSAVTKMKALAVRAKAEKAAAFVEQRL